MLLQSFTMVIAFSWQSLRDRGLKCRGLYDDLSCLVAQQ
ncbi:hypothetical protein C427_5608 [Paraglaciecola psychrophila 170]|uniref:Uncharacterized protein n=1 Tax=Paraglaciecola psychrophila 170 TaxID=1129794 RepID=M4SAJ8_9ALTE|nr:hypothetical protein C427_5608 [Paraglaciecola psychrophila 170]